LSTTSTEIAACRATGRTHWGRPRFLTGGSPPRRGINRPGWRQATNALYRCILGWPAPLPVHDVDETRFVRAGRGGSTGASRSSPHLHGKWWCVLAAGNAE
jgi:hypothetical protein